MIIYLGEWLFLRSAGFEYSSVSFEIGIKLKRRREIHLLKNSQSLSSTEENPIYRKADPFDFGLLPLPPPPQSPRPKPEPLQDWYWIQRTTVTSLLVYRS
jgi:hypothetical protein